MAATVANSELLARGKYTLYYCEVTLDSAYAASGESVNFKTTLGLGHVQAVFVSDAEGYHVEPNASTPSSTWLFKVFVSNTPDTNSATATPLEASVGRDLSAVTIPCLVVGR